MKSLAISMAFASLPFAAKVFGENKLVQLTKKS